MQLNGTVTCHDEIQHGGEAVAVDWMNCMHVVVQLQILPKPSNKWAARVAASRSGKCTRNFN